jgi:hypothetical protein
MFGNFSLLKYFFPKTKSLITPEEAINLNPMEMAKTLQYVNKLEQDSVEPRVNKAEKAKLEKLHSIMTHIKNRQEQSEKVHGGDDDQATKNGESLSSQVQPVNDEMNQNPAVVPVYRDLDLPEDGTIATNSIVPNSSIGTIDKKLRPLSAGNGNRKTSKGITNLFSSTSSSALPPIHPGNNKDGRMPQSGVLMHGFGENQKQRMEVGDLLPTGHKIKPSTPLSVVEQLNQQHGLGPEDVEGSTPGSGSGGGSRRRKKKRNNH